LGQQNWHLGRVLRMACRHRGRNDLPLVVHPEVELLPALDLLLAVFLRMPLPLPTDL
jgi:hypothetical protein